MSVFSLTGTAPVEGLNHRSPTPPRALYKLCVTHFYAWIRERVMWALKMRFSETVKIHLDTLKQIPAVDAKLDCSSFSCLNCRFHQERIDKLKCTWEGTTTGKGSFPYKCIMTADFFSPTCQVNSFFSKTVSSSKNADVVEMGIGRATSWSKYWSKFRRKLVTAEQEAEKSREGHGKPKGAGRWGIELHFGGPVSEAGSLWSVKSLKTERRWKQKPAV